MLSGYVPPICIMFKDLCDCRSHVKTLVTAKKLPTGQLMCCASGGADVHGQRAFRGHHIREDRGTLRAPRRWGS